MSKMKKVKLTEAQITKIVINSLYEQLSGDDMNLEEEEVDALKTVLELYGETKSNILEADPSTDPEEDIFSNNYFYGRLSAVNARVDAMQVQIDKFKTSSLTTTPYYPTCPPMLYGDNTVLCGADEMLAKSQSVKNENEAPQPGN